MDKTEVPNSDELKNIRAEYKAPVVLDEKKEVVAETPKVEKTNTAVATEEPKGKAEVVAVEEKKPEITLDTLSDDELIAQLEKRGKKIATETLTPEQQKKQADLEDAEKRQFAIANLNVTAEQYDEIKNVLNADGADLTKREFEKSYRSENKGATKEEIESAYKDYYNLAQTIKVKEKQIKKGDDDFEEEIEVEVEKPKFEEKLSKWGEQRIKQEAERAKAQAKQNQEWIDNAFNNHKAIIAKANEYSKVADEVVKEINFEALPIHYKFGAEGKQKEVKAIVKLDKKAQEEVQNYITNELPLLIVPTDKYKDKAEISKQVQKFIRDKYDPQVVESFYNLGQSEGINIGKIGGSAPHVVISSTGEDQIVSALEKSVSERLPDNPLHKI